MKDNTSSLWGTGHYNNIDDYIKNEYDQFSQEKIEGIKDVKIGNQDSYLIRARSDSNEVFQSAWSHRNVVLGNKYSYEIGFGNDGSGDNSKIKQIIWPMLYFD